MDRPFRKRTTLTARERLEFDQLVRRLDSYAGHDVTRTGLGWRCSVRVAFWKHQRLAALLVVIGPTMLVAAITSWWPLGLAGTVLLGLGITATIELIAGRILRRRLQATVGGNR